MFGRKSSPRDKQIKSLQKIRQIRSISPDKSKWMVHVKCRVGQVSLFIDLPPAFPSAPPHLHLEPGYTHRFFDHARTANLTELRSWGSHSDVAHVVNKVIQGMVADSPQKVVVVHQPQGQPQFHARGPPPSYGQSMQPGPPGGGRRESRHAKEDTDLAVMSFSIPSNLWEIPAMQRLSTNDMEKLIRDDQALRDLAFEIAAPLRDMKRGTQKAVADSAKANLARKEKIDRMSRECQAIRDEVDTVTQIFDGLNKQRESIMARFSPKMIVNEFDNAIEEVESQLSALKDKLDDEEIAPIKYIRTYSALRTRYHVLSAKKEKYVEIFGHTM